MATETIGCGCISAAMGCATMIFIGLFFVWFLFMGGCSLIVKKTKEGLEPNTIKVESPTKTP